MSFYFYDITFLVIFGIILGIFLIKKRKRLKREGILILYRTQIGIKLMDYISKKYKNFLSYFEYVLIFGGYILMLASLYLIFQLIYLFLKFPELIRAIKIPPIMPLIPYLPEIFNVNYLPPFYFTYWIAVLAITAIAHEFLHGIFFKRDKIKIKSTGFAFLGPFLAFFVEPDEDKVKKLGFKKQISALVAGSFANILVTVLFFVVLWLFFVSFFAASGVIFNTYPFSIINTSSIEKISNSSFIVNFDSGLNLTEIRANKTTYFITNESLAKLDNLSYVFAYENTPALKSGLNGIIIEFDGNKIKNNKDLQKYLLQKKPGDGILIKTLFNNSEEEYKIELISRPDNKSQAYLGIAVYETKSSSILGKIRSKLAFFKDPNTYYKPKFLPELMIFLYNLIFWMILINLGVALTNMLPLGIFDGGRVFFLSVFAVTKSEKIAKKVYMFSTYFLIFLFLLLTILWFFSFR